MDTPDKSASSAAPCSIEELFVDRISPEVGDAAGDAPSGASDDSRGDVAPMLRPGSGDRSGNARLPAWSWAFALASVLLVVLGGLSAALVVRQQPVTGHQIVGPVTATTDSGSSDATPGASSPTHPSSGPASSGHSAPGSQTRGSPALGASGTETLQAETQRTGAGPVSSPTTPTPPSPVEPPVVGHPTPPATHGPQPVPLPNSPQPLPGGGPVALPLDESP